MATKKKEKGGGLGLAAAVVGAAAAGYYLFGPKGEVNRKKIQAWSLKAKAEVLEQFEKKKDVTKEQYEETIDKVTSKYAKLKSVGEVEATKLNRELKRHWKAIAQAVDEKPKKRK
jgi:hypothetical protein